MIISSRSFQFLGVFLFLINYGGSVDRNNFKTCEQSSFCRRCRKMEPGKSAYELDLDTLHISDYVLKVQVVTSDAENNAIRFNLRLTPLVDNTLSLEVAEANPLRQRFVPDVLVKSPEVSKFSVLSRKENLVELQFGDYTVELQAVPFRLDIKRHGNIVISANPRGLFKFEHTRKKPEQPDESEDPGSWEENFKAHQDSKPFGPTAVAMDISFPGAKVAYGLPEHADSHALRTTTKGDPYRFYNLDVFEYEMNSVMALYASIPFLIAHSEDLTTGVLWLNPSETWVDVAVNGDNVVSSIVNFVSGGRKPQVDTHFMSESGNMQVYFTLGPRPHDVFRQYTVLAGTAPLPPEFSLGFHQSRWNYNDEQDVISVIQGFDYHNIPVDVIWLDIEHTDNKKYFTWDPFKFPNPIEMLHNLTASGRKLVTIVDPHVKRDSTYFLHNEATNKGYYVKNRDNNDYEGWCWPGSSSYLDFLNPEVRSYYGSLYKFDKYQGSTEDLHIWNDMNEPSVFNGPEITMPKDNVHHGGWEHREIHNMYGYLNVLSSYEGVLNRADVEKAEDRKRPFILTRSAFVGSHRYAAIWTGDNAAEWSHLAASIPMCLSLAIAGFSFCGADVGGFFNNPDSELFTRWHQAGAFLPFFRAHAHLDTKRREPWLFGDEVLEIVKDTLKTRYSYIPLWYTLFYQQNTTGAPVIRPLWSEFPGELDSFSVDNEFLVGNSLLVRPVTESNVGEVSVYFPGSEDVWYDIETYDIYTHGQTNIVTPLSKIPVFQRGGTIVPRKMRARRASSLMRNDPYTLVVALNSQGKASGYLYIDDGSTFRYLSRKDSSVYIHYTFADNKLTSTLVGDNRFATYSWIEKIIILGLKPGSYKATAVSGDQEKSLETIYDTKKSLTIRKPGFNAAKEWHIKLH